VFCWDVHLNNRGEVDAFQYLSSNGKMADGGSGGGIAVGGTTDGTGGFIGARLGSPTEYFAQRRPLFSDHHHYVQHGSWVTWDPAVAQRPLDGLRGGPRRRPVLAKRVKAARFHGVDVTGIPLFAMGQGIDSAEAEPVEPPRATEHGSEGNVQTRALQERLQLLHSRGLLDVDPGPCDGKPGRHTVAAVAAFQRGCGLKVDGVAGPATLAMLERRFRSEVAATVPPAATAAAAEAFAEAPDWTECAQLYFRHGVARPGEMIELVLRGKQLPSGPLTVTLHHSDGRAVALDSPLPPIMPAADYGHIYLRAPWRATGEQIVARVAGADLQTPAPLYVIPTAELVR
jgi:hypothetical protein